MAHICDYQSHMPRDNKNLSHSKILRSSSLIPNILHGANPRDYAYILTLNLVTQNPTWAIDSLFNYAMRQYAPYNVTPRIIGKAMKDYIDSKTPQIIK